LSDLGGDYGALQPLGDSAAQQGRLFEDHDMDCAHTFPKTPPNRKTWA